MSTIERPPLTDAVALRLRCHQVLERLKDDALAEALETLLILAGELSEDLELSPRPEPRTTGEVWTCVGREIAPRPSVIDPD